MNNNNQPVILVVDDIATNIALVKAVLRSRNYEVLSAASGAQALEIAEERIPDVVILDIMMPVMDGYEVLARLRSNEKTKGIKIVMLSAIAKPDDIRKAMELGADDYITKPLVAKRLYDALDKLL
ncbi:MAG: PleD family two-component system response regulator [Candidatus Cryptobacteroides sp.]